MTSHSTMREQPQLETEAAAQLFDNWFDPIEAGLRDRAREFLQAMLEGELDEVLDRSRYARRAKRSADASERMVGVPGHRHGHRPRTLLGTFGQLKIEVPRARLDTSDGKTTEWKSQMLRAYQRRTLAADALIAGCYLSGTNTRRVRRALRALFGGAVGKDTVSRVWRKVKSNWEAWNAHSSAEEPIVRLILDGTVVRVPVDRQATSISLLVVLHVPARPKGVSGNQEHGRREHRGLANGARRSHPARPAAAGIPDRGWRAGAGECDRCGLGRRSGPALHRPQASQFAGARTRAPA